jgi:hypothetical protein
MGIGAYLYVVLIWTICTFVPMYGDMAISLSTQQYPLLAAPNNSITWFFAHLYAWDRFITFGVVANLVVVICLAFVAFRSLRRAAPVASDISR